MFFSRRNDSYLSLLLALLVGSLVLLQLVRAANSNEGSREKVPTVEQIDDLLNKHKQDAVLFTTKLIELYYQLKADIPTEIDNNEETRDALKAVDAHALDFFKSLENNDALLKQITGMIATLPKMHAYLTTNWVRAMPTTSVPVKEAFEKLNPLKNPLLLRRLKSGIQERPDLVVLNEEFVEAAKKVCKIYHFESLDERQLHYGSIPNLQLSKLIYAIKIIFNRLQQLNTNNELRLHYYLAIVCENIGKYPQNYKIYDRVVKEAKFLKGGRGELPASMLTVKSLDSKIKRAIDEYSKDKEEGQKGEIEAGLVAWAGLLEEYLLHKAGRDHEGDKAIYELMETYLINKKPWFQSSQDLTLTLDRLSRPFSPTTLDHESDAVGIKDNEISGDDILAADLLRAPSVFERKFVDLSAIFNPRIDSEFDKLLLASIEDSYERSKAYRYGEGICAKINWYPVAGELIDSVIMLIQDSGYDPLVKEIVLRKRERLSWLDILFLNELCFNLLKRLPSDNEFGIVTPPKVHHQSRITKWISNW